MRRGFTGKFRGGKSGFIRYKAAAGGCRQGSNSEFEFKHTMNKVKVKVKV